MVATSDDQAQKYTTVYSSQSVYASDQVLEARAEVSSTFFRKLADLFNAILAKLAQLIRLSRRPFRTENNEALVVNAAPTEPLIEPLPLMRRVSNWKAIKAYLNIETVSGGLLSRNGHPLVETNGAAEMLASSTLSPSAYEDALKQYEEKAGNEADFAMFLSLRSHTNNAGLVSIVFSALRTDDYKEEAKRLMIYMFQEWYMTGWSPELVKKKFMGHVDAEDEMFVDAFILLYTRYCNLSNKFFLDA
uniref:Uncharacterized protein n=1 Tax=Peronospora matthiolae TaxID=2874970 RepID=A0AAV1UH98_9STRA